MGVGQPITTVELFFDQVYVFAVSQLSHVILGDLTVAEDRAKCACFHDRPRDSPAGLPMARGRHSPISAVATSVATSRSSNASRSSRIVDVMDDLDGMDASD